MEILIGILTKTMKRLCTRGEMKRKEISFASRKITRYACILPRCISISLPTNEISRKKKKYLVTEVPIKESKSIPGLGFIAQIGLKLTR